MSHSNARKYETVDVAERRNPKEGASKPKESTKKKRKKYKDEEVLSDEDYFAVVPPNGGWGWVVVLSAFYCNVVVDGIQLTFGIFLKAISKEFSAEFSKVALAGSLMFGVHLLMGPVCSGCNAAFGLRPVTITGSLICCFGVGISYFSTGYYYLYFTFGLIGGIGLGLVYMNTLVITSLYFTSLMPIAIALVVCGTGIGTMVFAAMGSFLLSVTTWQNSFLMQAALAGSMSIVAITFKPLKPARVHISVSGADESHSGEQGSSARRRSVFIRTEMLDRGSIDTVRPIQTLAVSFAETVSEYRDTQCFCSRCCRKKKKAPEVGNILVLMPVESKGPEFGQKSYVEKNNRRETEEEEVIAVTERTDRKHSSVSYKQVYTRVDLKKERSTKNFLVTLKRTMIAMLDCRLLRSFSFFVFTLSGAVNLASYLIIFIYEKDRCETLGFSDETSVYFIITLGGANVVWRLCLGGIALIPKVHYWALAISGMILGGVATMVSGYSANIYFQFAFCIVFGFGMASFAVFRMPLLIDLVGMELLENATGINLLFMGVLCIIFPPLFGWIKQITNSYNVIFMITGSLIVLSALMLIGLKKVNVSESKNNSEIPKMGTHKPQNIS